MQSKELKIKQTKTPKQNSAAILKNNQISRNYNMFEAIWWADTEAKFIKKIIHSALALQLCFASQDFCLYLQLCWLCICKIFYLFYLFPLPLNGALICNDKHGAAHGKLIFRAGKGTWFISSNFKDLNVGWNGYKLSLNNINVAFYTRIMLWF